MPSASEVHGEDEIEASAETITNTLSNGMAISSSKNKKKRRIRLSKDERSNSMTDSDTPSNSPRVAFAPLPRRKEKGIQHVVSKTRQQSIQNSALRREQNRDDGSISPTSRRSRGFSNSSFGRSSTSTIQLNGKDGVVIVARILPLVIRKEQDGRWFVKWNDEDLNVVTELGYSLDCVRQQTNKNKEEPGSPRHVGATKMRVQWIGMPRISTHQSDRMENENISAQDRVILQQILSSFGCVPIWPSSEIMRRHHVFCSEILRPVIHNVYDPYGKFPTRLWKKENHSEIWRAYV